MRAFLISGLLLAAAGHMAAQTVPAADAALDRLQTEARTDRLLDLAAVDLREKRLDSALRRVEEAASVRPKDPVILNTKGAILIEMRRFPEARAALEQAIAADPSSFAPRYNLGEILTLEKKYTEAAEHYKALASTFSDVPLLRFKIYLCTRQAGETTEAQERLLALSYPGDGAAWYFAHAVDQLDRNHRTEARRLVAAAEAIHPKDSETYHQTLKDADLLP